MRAALAKTTGSKGPKGLRKHKATMPLKKLSPAIKLARENAHLKLKGSTLAATIRGQRPQRVRMDEEISRGLAHSLFMRSGSTRKAVTSSYINCYS